MGLKDHPSEKARKLMHSYVLLNTKEKSDSLNVSGGRMEANLLQRRYGGCAPGVGQAQDGQTETILPVFPSFSSSVFLLCVLSPLLLSVNV